MPIRISDTSGVVGCIYDVRWKERKVPARVREGERTRERGLNTDSTIPGRLAFHRQSGPSTTDRKVRVFPPSRLHIALSHPFLTSSSLLCSFLVSWLLIEALSLSIIRDRTAGAPRLFLRLVERSPPAIRILSPSSSFRPLPFLAIDIASIESDVEGALSGSSRRPEYPAATFSVPPLLLGKLLRWHRWEEVCRTSIPNKVSGPRFSCLQIDPEPLIRS